jgi:hypothetical protein
MTQPAAGWPTRLKAGEQHEQRVAHELTVRGWAVHRCGQGTYPLPIQRALSRTESPLRQFPDLIAARGPDLVTIDAKTDLPSNTSGRYAVSRRCLLAGLQFLGLYAPIPLYYVFGDLTVLTPAEIMHYSCPSLRHPGGAYHLVNTGHAHHFDEVFGAAASLSA